MGMTDAAHLLQGTLDEEHACNNALTSLAERKINLAAEAGDHGAKHKAPPSAKPAAAKAGAPPHHAQPETHKMRSAGK